MTQTTQPTDIQALNGKSMDLTEQNIEQLKALFPSVFKEGKIDFEALKSELGESVEASNERYQFTWAGKEQAKRIATTPTLGTLRPAPEESVNWDSTENLYIEGDNLEVLKLLQKSYFGKVKMIYIDPPYNTGKDFVYKDDFKDNLANYQRLTGQKDEKGNPLTTNTDSTGRYHSNWLNMMYPRLKLARNLMQNDGVIFISIDSNEVSNLHKLCEEIFGETNFVGDIIWKNVTDNNPTNIATEHEYIVVYAKSKSNLENFWKSQISDVKDLLINIGNNLISKYDDIEQLQNAYTVWYRENKSQLWPLENYKFIDKKGVYSGERGVHNPGKEGYRYDIIHPETGKPCKEPLMGYRFPEETMQKMVEEGRILFGEDENKLVEIKVYAADYQQKLSSVYNLDGRSGANELKDLFTDTKKIFTNPKTIKLLEELISFASNDQDVILDFFGGSGSSAHAVLKLNVQEKLNRKFIQVQIPETTFFEDNGNLIPKQGTAGEAFRSGYRTIAEIGKERIRRAAKKIKEEHPDTQADLGFKVFKLDTSNIKKWQPNVNDLETDLLNAVDNIVDGRTSQDLLFEVLIKYGLPLTLPIDEVIIGQHQAFNVAYGSLIACFDENITLETVQAIANLSTPENPVLRVVFRDTSFKDDITKTNAIQRLKQAGIEDVLSI